MRRVPDDLLPRLGKLLLCLTSDKPGEVAAAAAAVCRTLAGAGCDMHDLVACLTAAPAAAAPDRAPPSGWDKVPADELLEMIDAIEASARWLSPNSQSFLKSMRERAETYDPVFVSARQDKWLRDLMEQAHAAQ